MGHKTDEDGNVVPVEGKEAREQGAKQLLNRIQNGPKSKDNPDGYDATDLVVYAKIIQKSDIRNRHEKHHDDMRAADNRLTKRTMDAINRDPALQKASKDFVLDSIHIDKVLGLSLDEEGGVDEFLTVYGIGDDGVARNEVDQIKEDFKNGKIKRAEAERRIKEQKDRVYAVIRQDLTVDYESNTIKFKQEFENPDFDPSKPESEENPRMKESEYSLWDWFARAKGLARAVAMELQQNEFMIFALNNGSADINQWPDSEKARWYNKENNKIQKEENERIKLGEKPPFKDLDKRRKRNNTKWGKVDNKAMTSAEKRRLKKK